jgi:hypothetical protein
MGLAWKGNREPLIIVNEDSGLMGAEMHSGGQ